jgi:DNA repair protein RadC
VELARVVDRGDRVQRDAADLTTTELLAIVRRGTLKRADEEAVVAAIDNAELDGAGGFPDPRRGPTRLSAFASAFVAALLELARRVALGPPPVEIRGAEDVALIAQRELGRRHQECVLTIACDAANEVLRTEIVSRGTADRASVPVREILSAVLRADGRAFAIAHNHPTGMLEATDADIAATERVAAGARAVGLRFLGHVVVGQDARYVDVPNSRLRAA